MNQHTHMRKTGPLTCALIWVEFKTVLLPWKTQIGVFSFIMLEIEHHDGFPTVYRTED
jgi:hypothetical protein